MYTEVLHPAEVDEVLLIPLPAPSGIARRLGLFRTPGRPFTDGEGDAAVLLQPHICQALRRHARLGAARLLTERQLALLPLVATAVDNASIARRLVLSRGTVRKHLENIYAKPEASGRTAALAQADNVLSLAVSHIEASAPPIT